MKLSLLSAVLLVAALVAACGRSAEIKVGSEVYLLGQSDAVPVAVDLAALDNLAQASENNDEGSLKELLYTNKVLAVPRNTRVLILETSADSDVIIKVRVLEGDSAHKTGWVIRQWLSHTKG